MSSLPPSRPARARSPANPLTRALPRSVRYFTTAHPQSGIFVPLARASKRHSVDSQAPQTPIQALPTLSTPTITPRRAESPAPRNFSSSMKTPSRPSLGGGGGRPSLVPPVTPRSGSAMGSRIGALSPTPGGRPSFGSRSRAASTAGENRPGSAMGGPRIQIPKTPTPSYGGLGLKQPKSGMRSGSSLGLRPGSAMDQQRGDEQQHHRQHDSSPIDSGIGMMGKGEEDEMRAQMAEKDRQLREQAAALTEMENSLVELQSFMATAGGSPAPAQSQFDDADSAQLRVLLQEKNNKLNNLTTEFDAHPLAPLPTQPPVPRVASTAVPHSRRPHSGPDDRV